MFFGLLPDEVPFWLTFDLDWRVVGFTLGVAGLTCVAVGLPPALAASRGGERRAAASRAFDRGRQGLIVGQVALLVQHAHLELVLRCMGRELRLSIH